MHYLLDSTYPNSSIVYYDDVMLAVKFIMGNSVDVFFADKEALRFADMLHKSKEGVAIVIFAEHELRESDPEDMGASAFLFDPITKETMIGAMEGVCI